MELIWEKKKQVSRLSFPGYCSTNVWVRKGKNYVCGINAPVPAGFLPEPGTGREGPTGTDALIRAIYAGYKKL
ncbi:hypothetical protein HMPREF1548_06887 [Clostridium sp. KLE 1755]|uniref:Uncharacterized protein n=1 Tax=Eisenbergiella massiliensis TaxID=1720294 RepID=A0A3E3IW73_9FIRM|nr:hypothetical protein HMPREF1548_06887 [Clostridium sp. KLE 1755]RGE58549.1 hypothetical protein DXC51_16760 [Eisenbergiella massiliensis]RGE71305.1 hypothetical protein DWY69_14070 [Eisenbergiella massiliensis]